MAEVISLAEHRPHMTGEVRCIECGHTWCGVAPIGTVALECPQCGTMKGCWVAAVQPGAGLVWRCDCGNDLFTLTPKGAMCARCGVYAQGWA